MRRLAIPLFWIGFAFVSTVQTWVSMITHGHSPVRIALFQLGVWSAWIAVTYGILALAQRVPPTPVRLRSALIHFAAAFTVAVAHVAWWLALTVWVQPYDHMTIQEFGPAFPFAVFARLPLELILYAGVMATEQMATLARRTADLERSLANARTHALELQLQPHFLFNTLNAVCSLVRTHQNDEAVELMAGLCDLLRYTLDHAGKQRVSLEQEAAMLHQYLVIQRVRFPDRLDVAIDVPAEVRRATVPTLLLQPLAENAIRHGIARVASPGRVELRAFRHQSTLTIEMFNTGTLGTEGRGIGLTNTEERLRQLYGENQHFELRACPGGVLASITIPWSESA